MPNTLYLNLPQVSASQNQKEVTINDAIAAMEAALNASLVVSFAGGNTQTLTGTQATRNIVFRAQGATGACILNFPTTVNSNPFNRLFSVSNESGYGLTVQFPTGGGTTVVIPNGHTRLIAALGGVNMLSASETVTVGAFLGLSDTPLSFSGFQGRLLAVNTAENAVEFIAMDRVPDKTGHNLQILRVNSAGTGLEWVANVDAEYIRDTIGAALVAGSGALINVNDPADTITISADPEFIRDTIGATLVAGTNIAINVNDAGDTITISTTAVSTAWKDPCRASTTANVNLATGDIANGTVHDGVTLATGDRVFVQFQTAPAENGIYIVPASGAASRAADADTGAEMLQATFYVEEGTSYQDKQFTCSTDGPITLGTTALSFVISGAGGMVAASRTDVLTGTDTAKGVTADALSALWAKPAPVASAATVTLGDGGYFNITGTTTISTIAFATDTAGRAVRLYFSGALTLTNSGTLILPTGANITTAAGDVATFVSEGSGTVRCIGYQRANGMALAGGGTTLDSLSDVDTSTVAPIDGQSLIWDQTAGLWKPGVPGSKTPITLSGTSHTLAQSEDETYTLCTSASAVTITLPLNATIPIAPGFICSFEQNGAGTVTIAAASGVTVHSRGGLLSTAGQYGVIQVKKVATDTWTVIGDAA